MEPQYTTTIIPSERLTEAQRESMLQLYLSHYDASCRELFMADLASKSEVLLVWNGSRLAGFTTIEHFFWDDGDQTLSVVYSGDTIVDPTDWGQQALAFSWIRRMGELKRQHPDLPLYWLLIVKGHRTFKYLPAFGKTFFPHWRDSDNKLADLAARLAHDRFGEDFNQRTGVVEFPESRGQLKAEISEPSAVEMQKECVRFFLRKNPGFRLGHELVCLCALDETNMRPLTRRLFTQAGAA